LRTNIPTTHLDQKEEVKNCLHATSGPPAQIHFFAVKAGVRNWIVVDHDELVR